VLGKTFDKMVELTGTAIFGCHDPLTIYALLESKTVEWETGLDIRIETDGIWTRGEMVFDTRGVVKLTPGQKAIIRDNGGWRMVLWRSEEQHRNIEGVACRWQCVWPEAFRGHLFMKLGLDTLHCTRCMGLKSL
jgi:hypothetical protein